MDGVSKYCSELVSEDQQRYIDKIKLINNVDPYLLSAKEFSNQWENIPQIKKDDIMEYLLLRASPFTHEQMKAHKSIGAFAQVVCGWVKDLKTTQILQNHLFLGKVLHSERLNEVPLKPWCILNSQGKILAAHCDCKAGLGEVCSHVAAILYTLLERKPEESVTDRLAYWIAPAATNLHLSIDEIDFSSSAMLWQKSSKIQNKTATAPKKRSKDVMSRDEVITFLKRYKEAGCDSSLHKILKPFTETAIGVETRDVNSSLPGTSSTEDLQHKTILEVQDYLKKHIYCKINVDLPVIVLNAKEEKHYNEHVKVSMEAALDIAAKTFGQDNALWKMYRRQRITASKCYQLYTYCNNKNPDWENKIENYINSKFKGNKHTLYGKKCEPVAREVYEAQFGKVYQTGLVINPSHPWLACSPDGLKMFEGRFYKTVEIKSPVLVASQGIEEVVPTLTYIKYDETKLFPYCLNRKHIYYGQVQLGMAILNLEMCDFVLYISYDNKILVIEVERDEEFINSLINKLHFVYFNYYLKKIC